MSATRGVRPGRRVTRAKVVDDVRQNVEALVDAADTGDLPGASRRLLVAAVDAFAERGYHATTTRDIAKRAGMSPAALYVHYRSKEELLFLVMRVGHEQALLAVRHAVAPHGTPTDRLQAYVRAFTYWHARQHTIGRVVQDELDALSPDHFEQIAGIRRATERVLRDVIADGVAEGTFSADDVPATALAILSLSI